MQTYFDAKDGRECSIIFTENGLASIRLNGDVRHQVPVTRLRTPEQQAAWLAIHPQDKKHLHEVLEVVAEAKAKPRQADEADAPWLAHLRARGIITANLKYDTVEDFLEQYEAASGIKLTRTSPGVYINAEGNGKWKNSLLMRFTGEIPPGCPEQITPCGPNEWSLNNTRFLWTLIAREGFTLGL